MQIFLKAAPFLFSIIAGLAGTLNFAPYNLWWLSLALLIPLFSILHKTHVLKGLFCIYLFWLAYFLSGMIWIRAGIDVFNYISSGSATIITIGFAVIYAAILTSFWCPLFLIKRGSFYRLCAIPAIWAISEWLRYWLFDGLTWLIHGYGHQNSFLSGWIPVLGVFGASFFSVLTATLIVQCIKQPHTKTPIFSLATLFIIWTAGHTLSKLDWTDPIGIDIPVTAIQPNIPLGYASDLDTESRHHRYTEILETASIEYWKKGLLIWPEGSIRFKQPKLKEYLDTINNRARLSETAFLTSAPYYPPMTKPEGSATAFNSLFGLGLAEGIYHKVYRAPLGEYSPLGGRLGKVFPMFNAIEPPEKYDNLLQKPLIFNYSEQPFLISASICYEIAFGHYLRNSASLSNILVNVSNDVWFDGTRELDQALQIAQIRALEHQKPMIRSANTGITALIDHKGDIIKQIPRGVSSVLNGEIEPRTGETPYSKWGDMPILVISLLILVLGFIDSVRNRLIVSEAQKGLSVHVSD